MRYSEARDRIKTGDMLLWVDHHGGDTRGVIERWIVRHGTASPYTHVGIAWVICGRLMVMELTLRGCAPRLLSLAGSFDWAPAPRELSENGLSFALSCFGVWIYSRWQAILGALKALAIGVDQEGQCAEFALAVWGKDGMAPGDTATPGACAEGALEIWKSTITRVTQ